MDADNKEDKTYLKAEEKLRKIKVFYIHLLGYIVLVSLLVYNLIIIKDVPSKDVIIWINCSTIFIWGVFLIIHAWTTFKGPFLFGKHWEERRVEKYLQEEEQMWE